MTLALAGFVASCGGGGGTPGSGGSTGGGSGGAGTPGTGGSAPSGSGGSSGSGGAIGSGGTGPAPASGGATGTGTGGSTPAGTGGSGATGTGGTSPGATGGSGAGGRGNGTGGSAPGTGGTAPGGTGGSAGGAPGTMADPCRGTALPPAQHYVPAGMCARMVASGQGDLRQITFTSNGDLWGVASSGQIKRYRDANNDGVYQANEVVTWASTGGNGQNAHIDEAGGWLYAGTTAGVKRWRWSNTTDAGGAGEDVMTGQPGTGGHSKHTVHVWDGFMYVMSGSAGNVTNTMSPSYDTTRSLIKRFNMAMFTAGTPFQWSAGMVYTDGLRNTLGFNRDAMGRIFGVQNGQDNVTYGGTPVFQDNPGEIIHRVDAGLHYGYPFCYTVQRIATLAPGINVRSEIFPNNPHNDAWCQNPTNVAKPVTFLQAHTAPMDIVFYTGPFGSLPEKWRNGAFVSLHGSWNREVPTGYKVVWVPFSADGTSPMPTNTGTTTTFPYEVVLSGGSVTGGSRDGTWNWMGGESNVKPVGVAVSPIDGALYISSDSQGYLYRVGLQR